MQEEPSKKATSKARQNKEQKQQMQGRKPKATKGSKRQAKANNKKAKTLQCRGETGGKKRPKLRPDTSDTRPRVRKARKAENSKPVPEEMKGHPREATKHRETKHENDKTIHKKQEARSMTLIIPTLQLFDAGAVLPFFGKKTKDASLQALVGILGASRDTRWDSSAGFSEVRQSRDTCLGMLGVTLRGLLWEWALQGMSLDTPRPSHLAVAGTLGYFWGGHCRALGPWDCLGVGRLRIRHDSFHFGTLCGLLSVSANFFWGWALRAFQGQGRETGWDTGRGGDLLTEKSNIPDQGWGNTFKK